MKKAQVDQFVRKRFGPFMSRPRNLIQDGLSHAVMVTKGEFCGLTGMLDAIGYGGTLTIVFDATNEVADVNYRDVEFLDDNGEIIESNVLDMLNQVIEEGQLVTYPTSGFYGKSFSMEIGTVTKITVAGNLMVEPRVRDGERLRGAHKARKVEAKRSVRIPVDDTTLVTAVLTDFEILEEDA